MSIETSACFYVRFAAVAATVGHDLVCRARSQRARACWVGTFFSLLYKTQCDMPMRGS